MAAVLGHNVHLLGGANSTGSFLADHWIYDPGTDSWTAAVPLPVAVDAAAVVVFQNRLFIIGGATSPGSPTNLVQIYDPRSGSWSFGTPMPTPRLSPAFAISGNTVHVAGGQTSGFGTTAATEAYDPHKDSWNSVAPMPAEREALGAGALGSALCAFGGRLTNPSPSGDAFADTSCYDRPRNSWNTGPDMLTARVEMAVVDVAGAILAIGGRSATAIVTGAVELLR
jgi:N-acetylneuraminic acid mutarotase